MNAEFAERINPRNFNFSPTMQAIVGAIIGHDYGVRHRYGARVTGISITSDGYVLLDTDPVSSGFFLDTIEALIVKLYMYVKELSNADRAEFNRLYVRNIKDYRPVGSTLNK